MAHFTSSGNTLANYDYGFHHIHCPLESYTVKETVNIVATYCCGTGDAASRRSGCWADYSYLCADPSSYMPSAEWEAASADNGNTATSCDQIMDYATSPGQALEGDDFSSASTAKESCTKSAAPGHDARAAYVHHVGVDYKCCSSGDSVCSDIVDSATLGGRVASAVGAVSVFAVLLGLH